MSLRSRGKINTPKTTSFLKDVLRLSNDGFPAAKHTWTGKKEKTRFPVRRDVYVRFPLLQAWIQWQKFYFGTHKFLVDVDEIFLSDCLVIKAKPAQINCLAAPINLNLCWMMSPFGHLTSKAKLFQHRASQWRSWASVMALCTPMMGDWSSHRLTIQLTNSRTG